VALTVVAVSISAFLPDRVDTLTIDKVVDRAVSNTHLMALEALEPATLKSQWPGSVSTSSTGGFGLPCRLN
jgi:hypothetical protein